MPFHLRTVQPTQVCRLGDSDGFRDGSAPAFNSLEEVSVHSMLRVFQQLSDLSRLAEDIFSSIHGQAVTLGKRSARLQRRLSSLHHFVAHLDHRKVPVPVSNLDEESKWTVHYTASWHQQENVFLPSSRPQCVEDLHQQAKVNLKTVLRECDKLRRDGYRSSQYYSQGPTFSSPPNMVCTSYPEDDEEYSRKFSISSNEEERLLTGKKHKTPVPHEFSDTHTNWTRSLPLPTPEEKMRQEAQAVQTDVVPINVTAATGQLGFRGHSMHIPESYNALDNQEPCLSPSQRSETRDFSSQTEAIKIVPPSVRRIRAQKGQGIAALMSNSSGNMSTISDPAGCTLRPNGDLNFRSLPRTGARVCLQSLEQRTESSSRIEDSFITLPHQLSTLQMDDSVVQVRNNHRTGTLPRPKSQEVRGSEREVFSNPACVVSPHAAYSTSVIPNAMLSSSSEVIAINTSQSSGQLDCKPTSHGSTSHSKSVSREHGGSIKGDHHFCTVNWSENSSQASDVISPGGNSMNNGPQSTPYKRNAVFNSHPHDSDTHSESSYSDGRQRNGSITSSINSADQWQCEPRENDSNASLRKPSSAVSSSPVSNRSTCSSDRKADSSSLYSLDHDGYYTSMHMDSGVESGNQRQHNGIQNLHHSVNNIYDKKDTLNQDDRSSYSDKSLTRSISLKKSKKPPPPPSRTDSLRRPPKKDIQSNGQVLNEKLIASLQQSLQLNLKSKGGSSPSQSPCSDYEDPWVLRSRSQSNVSASSSGLSATAAHIYSICPITPSQSETSSIKSEYADQWSYCIDEQPKSTMHSPKKSPHSSGQQMHSGLSKPINSSPEKPCRVTSPSSGYSSQSNTPTNLTPVPLLLRTMSPGTAKNKVKPKVPERRSSLISSVSISTLSTSLSSITSDSVPQSTRKPTMVLPSSPTPPLTPDPPPPAMINVVDNDTFPPSPNFPPPPAAVFLSPGDNLWLTHSENTDKYTQEAFLPPTLPPPPLPTLHSKAAPKVLPLNTETLKMKNELLPQRNKDTMFVNRLNNSPNKQELVSPIVPLITAQALQMVQLRSVKKSPPPEAENIAEQVFQPKIQYEMPPLFSQPSSVPSVSSDLSYSGSIGENENLNSQDEQLQYSYSPNKSARFTTVENRNGGCREEEYQDSAHNGDKTMLSEMSSPQEKASTSQSPPNVSPNKKPPPVSKKPKLFLIVPPPQLDLAAEKIAKENVRSMPKASETDSVSEHCEEVNSRIIAEDSSEECISLNSQAEETVSSCKVSEDIPVFTLTPALESPNHQEEEEQPTMSDEASVPDGKNGRTNCDQKIFQEGIDDVFETKTASSPLLLTDDKLNGHMELLTPTRPRTTEDLFAVIHRSKRKVLGRKDSDDDRCRNHSPSPPVTPTGLAPNVSSFKQPGAIQRNIRKSYTSNDSFKALLLKKGSRSECGFRMSAAEMLKHTDPRFQRSHSDSSLELPDSPTLNSPNKNKKAQEEWAKSEGLMPRSMSVSGTRYSRSRTPPSAASSKYNVRSRLQSSPMTVICEGEGETADVIENSCTKAPLMSTMSLDRFQRMDSELNDSFGAENSNPRVHVNLMSRLSDVSPSKDNDSS